MAEAKKKHATGRIEVGSYQPKPYEEPSDGPALVEIHVREKFIGDIEGEGVVRFLQAQRQDGSASFVGIERVSGRIGDREGTFLISTPGDVFSVSKVVLADLKEKYLSLQTSKDEHYFFAYEDVLGVRILGKGSAKHGSAGFGR